MAIVKRKDSLGRNYYVNTATNTRSTEAAYKRSKTAKKTLAPFAARSGRPSKSYCSTVGTKLVTKNTSAAGKALKSCVRPSKRAASTRAMFANIARRKG